MLDSPCGDRVIFFFDGREFLKSSKETLLQAPVIAGPPLGALTFLCGRFFTRG